MSLEIQKLEQELQMSSEVLDRCTSSLTTKIREYETIKKRMVDEIKEHRHHIGEHNARRQILQNIEAEYTECIRQNNILRQSCNNNQACNVM